VRYSSLVNRVAGKGAGAWRVHMDALRRAEAGEDIVFLTVGDPDQRPPSAVIEATVTALRGGRTGYAAITGAEPLRRAIARRFAARTGQPCAADNVVVVPGTQAALFFAMQCLVEPGDEVIVPEPMYATYEAVTGATGAVLVNVPLKSERGFHPEIADIAKAITPRTRVIWINSPHNPTGAVMTPEEIASVADLCRKHDLWLLSDEVYEDLAFARPHMSAWSLPGMAERMVVASSLSKSHAMPGFRLGWVIGPPDLSRHLFNLMLCAQYGGPPFLQDGALVALETELPEVAELREAYRQRGQAMTQLLSQAPRCRVIAPEGGMFVLLDVRATGLTSDAFAEGLLDAEGVAVLPCDGFGPSAAGHLRISLTADLPKLSDAGRRIVRYAERLARS